MIARMLSLYGSLVLVLLAIAALVLLSRIRGTRLTPWRLAQVLALVFPRPGTRRVRGHAHGAAAGPATASPAVRPVHQRLVQHEQSDRDLQDGPQCRRMNAHVNRNTEAVNSRVKNKVRP